MIKFYAPEYRKKIRHLLDLLLPIVVTQIALFGMNFFDASMSGQAGPIELAGTAMAGNLWMPIHVGLGTILCGCTPIIAQAIGAEQHNKIRPVLQQEMLLAGIFAMVIALLFIFVAPVLYDYLGLEQQVRHVATWYGISIACGFLPFFLGFPLRSFIDTLGYTNATMKIFLAALPINGILNYIFIFGMGPVPAMGGIGAGIATGITFWIVFSMFLMMIRYVPELREYQIFKDFHFDMTIFRECWKIGLPMGLGAFLECGVFAMTTFLISKFGTAFIAADMAATNFCTIIYMLPCSFSMASTILVGIAEGACRREDSHCYTVIAMQMNFIICVICTMLEILFLPQVISIYTKDVAVATIMTSFMYWGIIWQYFDAINAPLQGSLRGHKDVKFLFYVNIFVFWIICLPYGIISDYCFHRYPTCYWEGINLSLFISACLLFWRWKSVEQQPVRTGAK